MAPSIPISDGLFARLQGHAVPLVDTIESVIARAIDALEQASRPARVQGESVRTFNPAAPPNLTHTTLRSATLNGQTLPKSATSWRQLMHEVLLEAIKTGKKPAEVLALTVVPAVKGKKTEHGYAYLPEADLSIQGQDANAAWKQTYRVASQLNFTLEIEFMWQNNEKAAMPGVVGALIIDK